MKLDKYEADLIEAIDKAEQFETVTDYELELQEAKLAAKHFLNKTRNINIRIPEFDMLILKRKSAELNIPYQTLLSSLIHQYVTGKLKPGL